ncbi:hypothetical protein AzCIB_1382 [Azoarcus sp. CIB]|uniref:hypothetical protein n=1 Tax=Aromatoleum sp. (strain CIB) TaxID=198107 RepID=UPI00067C9F3E|nr:hypothetical protein [Azoarcus sp. CIB]AKU11287.1 hypothetical protein AzCIB_1382 [Azoarcus sp. CIB]
MSKALTQIPREELQVDRWYVGRGRNGNVGLWNGDCFLVIAEGGRKAGPAAGDWVPEWRIKQEPYWTETEGCFQPFRLIDEGRGDDERGLGWNSHYVKALTFYDEA